MFLAGQPTAQFAQQLRALALDLNGHNKRSRSPELARIDHGNLA
jgi:hypothetical protein